MYMHIYVCVHIHTYVYMYMCYQHGPVTGKVNEIAVGLAAAV